LSVVAEIQTGIGTRADIIGGKNDIRFLKFGFFSNASHAYFVKFTLYSLQ